MDGIGGAGLCVHDTAVMGSRELGGMLFGDRSGLHGNEIAFENDILLLIDDGRVTLVVIARVGCHGATTAREDARETALETLLEGGGSVRLGQKSGPTADAGSSLTRWGVARNRFVGT